MAKTGNMGLGIIIGFILMGIIGWIPIIGALIAGIIAGVIARGAGRGLLTGFIAGIIGILFLGVLITVIGGALGGGIGAAIGGIVGVGVGTVLGLLAIVDIFVVTVGGLIGGALSPREKNNKNNVENEQKGDTEEIRKKLSLDEIGSRNGPLNELKMRYVQGKITKAQYQRMKKDLEEE